MTEFSESRHDAQPDDSAEDLRVKLRRARFHERENYAKRMESDYWRAQLAEDVREVRDRCDSYVTDNPGVRMGLDLAAGWLDILLTRHGLADDPTRPIPPGSIAR